MSWLSWCASRKRWPAPQLPGDAERRKEHSDATRALPRARIERLLSRRDIPLREKALWRMLYETAARASEILALNVEDLDLLLIRISETTCRATWPGLRRELDRIALGTFTGPSGIFRQRTELTKNQRDILAQLRIELPPRIYQLTTPAP